MVRLPTPPWARHHERCPNCLAKVVDEKAVVCDACGYQLRVPLAAIVGLFLIALAVGSFMISAFGNWLFPWPPRPFGWQIPLVDGMTLSDVFWVGVALLLAGFATAGGGAYSVRRKSDEVARSRTA